MTKRTKRYGGFLVGDRVRVKDTAKTSCKGSGRVIAYNGPLLVVESYPMKGMIHEFAPRQLINLTRIDEENRKITGPLPPISEETAKELDERFDAICGNIRKKPMVIHLNPTREHWTKRFIDEWLNDLPSPYTRDVYTTTKDYFVS